MYTLDGYFSICSALASETQLERIAEQNKPSLAWKVLFEVAE